MPELDGIGLCKSIRERRNGDYIYTILLTSRSGTSNIVQGLDSGADDFITKPFNQDELHVRLRVAERILALEGRDLLIFSLAKLADSRDPERAVTWNEFASTQDSLPSNCRTPTSMPMWWMAISFR